MTDGTRKKINFGAKQREGILFVGFAHNVCIIGYTRANVT